MQPVPQQSTGPAPQEQPRTVQRTPPETQRPVRDETGLAVPDETVTTESTREELAEQVAYYYLDSVHMAVVSREALDDHGLGDDVAQKMREAFSELGMRVQNAAGASLHGTDANTIRRLSQQLDADLITVVLGNSQKRSSLGRMMSYEATLRGTVYEADGNLVATKEVNKVGDRSSRERNAERSALVNAAEELGPFLTEQIIRKVGQNVITRRLTIVGIQYHVTVSQIIAHLKSQPGINDVRLLHWNDQTRTAQFIIYLQPAARGNLGAYVSQTPDMKVRVLQEDQRGIYGRERRIDR
ncbi:MAG: hypothetical protein EA377_02300 [Phycisphaerales bacterium]|nr:MAG: hypothetical protein EA377_02300 [Phycisphaerales bacterium]